MATMESKKGNIMETKKNLKKKLNSLQADYNKLFDNYVILVNEVQSGLVIEIFKDGLDYRWKLTSPTGQTCYTSAQSYTKSNCKRSANRLQDVLSGDRSIDLIVEDE